MISRMISHGIPDELNIPSARFTAWQRTMVQGVMQCEKHIGVIWPHDDCLGPGMPLFEDLDDLRKQVNKKIVRDINEGFRSIPRPTDCCTNEADRRTAKTAEDYTTQRKEVKMDTLSAGSDKPDGGPLTIPKQFQKSLLIRKDELNALIVNAEDQLRAYKLELNMIDGALHAHDEMVDVTIM